LILDVVPSPKLTVTWPVAGTPAPLTLMAKVTACPAMLEGGVGVSVVVVVPLVMVTAEEAVAELEL
jgi:hypothetical protein